MRHLRHAALPVVPVALVLLAACGGGGEQDGGEAGKAGLSGIEKLTGSQILDKSLVATGNSAGAHLRGKSSGGTKIEMDFRLSPRAMTGKLTVSGQQVELLRVGTAVYFKADRGFWESKVGASGASRLDGKYFKTEVGDPKMKSLSELTDLPTILRKFARPAGTSKRGDLTTIDGKRAITVTNSSGDKIYVSAVGEPYILKIVSAGRGDTVRIDGFGERTQARTPSSGEVIDAGTLSRG